MNGPPMIRRLAEARLIEALEDTPAVMIHGSRQCGKTTLARMVGDARDYAYFSLDDVATLAAVRADPVGFVADAPERLTIDEVQRAPELFPALKSAIDRRRTPGRFILTGSSNLLLLPRLSESLVGRLEILRLRALSQSEVEGTEPWFLDALFEAKFATNRFERLGPELASRISAGGYPAARKRRSPSRRSAWYRDYVETLVQRDVRDLTRIRSLDTLPRLLGMIAAQTARLLNVSDLAAPFQQSRVTIRDYVTLLQRVFLVEELPPWHGNRRKRLVKTPKVHVTDTGIGCSLLGVDESDLRGDRELLGQFLESFVCAELHREASGQGREIRFSHFRNKDMIEVDIVLERGAREVAGVEVKAASTVRKSDFRGLRKLAELTGDRFRAGVLLYDGETSASFGDNLFAVPIRALWEGESSSPGGASTRA